MLSGDLLLIISTGAVLPYIAEAVYSWARTRPPKRLFSQKPSD